MFFDRRWLVMRCHAFSNYKSANDASETMLFTADLSWFDEC